MRAVFVALSIFLLFSCGTSFVQAQTSVPYVFSSNFSLGSSGAGVIALQQLLNRDAATRVASSGPGSPGNESGYFGALTKAAVIRFQQKYAGEILAPTGLTQGNGNVGMYTRAKLNALAAPIASTASPAISTPAAPVATALSSTTAIQNPNLENLDAYIALVDAAGKKQGLSQSAIDAANQKIREVAATTTDLRAEFLKIVERNSRQAHANDSVIQKIFTAVANVFMPQHALAGLGIPFGGYVVFPIPCDAGVWNIGITPLPPSYATVLSYVSGTQAFASYTLNLPHPGMSALGMFVPGPGLCVIGFVPIPSEGIITPMVGSSM